MVVHMSPVTPSESESRASEYFRRCEIGLAYRARLSSLPSRGFAVTVVSRREIFSRFRCTLRPKGAAARTNGAAARVDRRRCDNSRGQFPSDIRATYRDETLSRDGLFAFTPVPCIMN